MNIVTGLFRSRASAERAFQCVLDRGYEASDVDLFLSDETRKKNFSAADQGTGLGERVAEGGEKAVPTQLGGPLGGTLGTIGAAAAAIGTAVMLPTLGIVVAGPIAAALVAAGTVGLAGGLVGALTDWGVPADRLEHYEAGIREGGFLMGVKPRSEEDAKHFIECWKASGGEHIH